MTVPSPLIKPEYFFSLRLKLIFSFFAIGFGLSTFLGVVAYRILEEKLFLELRNNVGNITRMGAEILDKDAVAALMEQRADDLSAGQVYQIENSENFRLISEQLNFIRDTEENLIRYVYLVTPTESSETVRYLVDADVLKAGDDISDEISHFNTPLDVSSFPVLQNAIQGQKNVVEEDYVYDEAFKVNSVSGYAPVMARDGRTFLALLGLDMADTEVQAALSEVLRKSVLAAVLALMVSLMTAVAMGTLLTRGIVKLDKLVHSFAQKDFAARSHFRSNDEVGRLGLSFNHMAETIEDYSARLEALVAAYGRFVPHDLLKLLEKKSILDVNLGDQIERDMTVLFSDIRNFTSISESMSPEDNFNFINSYLSRVGPHIRTHRGIIDKYIGDAVMALFPGSVEDALDAAIKMQMIVREHNGDPEQAKFPNIKIGVGIHCGRVMLGTIGETQRMDGTVISDTVNLASRLEGMTKKYGANIIVSDTVLQKISQRDKYHIRMVDRVYVAGKNEAVTLYEIFNADDADIVTHKKATLADYNRAVACYYARSFDDAEKLFAGILAANENDLPARLFLEKSKEILLSGLPDGWDGVSRHLTKG